MIDLTPLDVRNKRGDFKKGLRGYDSQEVDVFLELAAERLEQLVMENLRLRERAENLQTQVSSQTGREHAVQEALVTAQELRADIRSQAEREADLVLAEAKAESRRLVAEAEAESRTLLRDAERRLDQAQEALEDLERRRGRFLRGFRQLLEREMDVVEIEESRAPLEDRSYDLDLGGGKHPTGDDAAAEARRVLESVSVDDSPEARPPLDVPVDELAAAYQSTEDGEAPADDPDGMEGGAGARGEDGLTLSLDDAPPREEDGRWG